MMEINAFHVLWKEEEIKSLDSSATLFLVLNTSIYFSKI